MHWIDKNGQQPTYFIIYGIFERYPSSSHPTDSAINYLAFSQRHSIHGKIVPIPFELYLPMDEEGKFLTLQARGGWK
eukprot:9820489-Ditylum_brightwellii.AAC.1